MSEWKLVPVSPVSEQFDELARDIVMWWCMSQPTGAALYLHLKRCGRAIPAWLPGIIQDYQHVPAKSAVAAAIYRAMLDAVPAHPHDTITAEQARSGQQWAGMDGAIAWHLIDRHANGWNDVAAMMEAWLDANRAAEPSDELARLRAENERLKADAARYQWMRDNSTHVSIPFATEDGGWNVRFSLAGGGIRELNYRTLNEAVDAAIAQSGSNTTTTGPLPTSASDGK